MAVKVRIALMCCGLALAGAPAANAADPARDFTDLVYATVAGKPLGLDLHLPPGVDHRKQNPVPDFSDAARLRGSQSGFPFFE